MAESLKNTALVGAFSDVVGDFADLLQKEMRLAKAELSAKLSAKLRAGVWMSVAALLGIFAALGPHRGRGLRHRRVRHRAPLVLSHRGGRSRSRRRRRLCQRQRGRARRNHADAYHSPNQTRHRDSQGAIEMSASAGNTSDWLLGAVKKNPEGLLLLAAGAVLLMRKAGGMGSTNAIRSAFRQIPGHGGFVAGAKDRGRREGICGRRCRTGEANGQGRLRPRRPNMPTRRGALFRDSPSGSWIRPSPRSKAR